MKLSQNDLVELSALAIETAKEAAALIQDKSGRHGIVQTKDGGDTHAARVVTEVDLASQELILEKLTDSIRKYDLGLLTEESQDDSSRHRRDFFWCIDPLDGTLPFTENRSGYSVSIALVRRDGIPQLGVITDPQTASVYHAEKGGGAFIDGRKLSIPPLSSNQPLTWVMDRSFRKIEKFPEVEKAMELISGGNGIRIIDHGGAAMNACWVLENSPAVYFKFPKPRDGGGSIWDYAASACIFSEMKIPPTNIHGSPLELNRKGSTYMNHGGLVYASSPELAEQVRQIYQSF